MRSTLLTSLVAWLLVCAVAAAAAYEPRTDDRVEIANLLTMYCSALDARDWDKWESVFTADAFLDYNEAFPGFEGSPKVMAAFYDKLLYFVGAPSVHLVANIEIEFTGPDSAKVRAMVYNPMMIRMLPLYPAYTFVGYYHHDMKRIGGRWKSTHLREEAGWNSAPNVAIYLVIGYGMYRLARPAAAAAKAKAKAG